MALVRKWVALNFERGKMFLIEKGGLVLNNHNC